jgi:hypothetical protein
MPEEPHVIGWRQRASALIAESGRARDALDNAARFLRPVVTDYQLALDRYKRTNALEKELEALNELGRRAGQRSVLLATRDAVAGNQVVAEADLYQINRRIAATQAVIGVGKLAEVGLGVATWVKSVKEALDVAKLVLDGVKAAQPVAQPLVGQQLGASSATGAADEGQAIAQIISIVLRVHGDFARTGKHLWDAVGTLRRARNMHDAWTAGAAMAQGLKTSLDLLKTIVERLEDFNKVIERSGAHKVVSTTKSALGPALGHLAAGLGVLRDLLEAGRAFAAAYDAYQQMEQAHKAGERWVAQGARYIGTEQDALAWLPVLSGVQDGGAEELVSSATDFNRARVLANAARDEARRVTEDILAASELFRRQRQQLRAALQPVEPRFAELGECLLRLRLQIADLNFTVGQRGKHAAIAQELATQLERQQALAHGTYSEVKSLLDRTTTAH